MARAAAKSATSKVGAKAAAKPSSRSRSVAAKAAKAKPKPKAAAKPSAKARVPIELYFWPTPNCQKISIFLEETGLPYVLKPVNITRGDQLDPAYGRIAPNQRVPAIVDPNGPGGKAISVFESGAILQYLGRKAGKFYSSDPRTQVDIDQWLFWQVGGLGPMAGQSLHFRQFAPEKIPYAIERYMNEVNRLYSVLDRRLAERDYLAGRYSVADMACLPWVQQHMAQGQPLSIVPHVRAWLDRLMARQGVKRGLAVGADLPALAVQPPARAHSVLVGTPKSE
ncbi:MAG: glutathione S-transferase family protein [Alphaproteobacteria bacterium]|nr:glutathione S-transferase family protein [Alphaproteobacteria bacterium]